MGAEHDERYVTTTIQDALLPAGLVALPGIDVAARYLLACAGPDAGGDWFDAVPLPGGRVALVVGDVVGHGVSASAAMGQLRAVLSAGLLTQADPVTALSLVDAYAQTVPEARGATVAVALVDPARPVVRYCTAGHPPPLAVRAAGETVFLPTSGAGPLGRGSTFTMLEQPLEQGDLVLLYSDGLVDRPGVPPAVGMLQLATTAARVLADPDPMDGSSIAERICDGALDLTRQSGVADDVALVAAHRLDVRVPELRLDLPAIPDTVRVARLELGTWLSGLRLSPIDQLAVQQSVGELVANAVTHAYPADAPCRDTAVRLSAQLSDDGHVVVDVEDDGAWHLPDDAAVGGGRGLAMARGFVDHLDVRPGVRGTRIHLRHRVLRPAALLTGDPRGGGSRSVTSELLDVRRRGRDVVEVSGAVAPASADRMGIELRRAVTTGSDTPLRVDLTDVTVLCSGGVQVLLDTVRSPGAPQDTVVLYAAPGSPAQHVLDLVQVPYEPRRPSP